MIFHGYLFEEKKDEIVCQYYDVTSNSVTDSAIMGRDPCCQHYFRPRQSQLY